MPDDDRVGASLGRRRLMLGWLLAVVGTVALTAVLVPAHSGPAPTFEAILYLALAVGCALVGGLGPALAASVLAVLSLNYWFTEPLHTLRVASGVNVLTLVTFALVSVAVSSVVDSAARRRAQASAARAEADTLAGLNRTLLAGDHEADQLLDLVRRTFGARSAELVPVGTAVAGGDAAADASRDLVLVLHDVTLDPGQQRVLAAFAAHLGVLREREELARQTAAARELEVGTRTRTALLAAVSHDLRTPLAGLRAAASTLRRHDADLAPADRADLLNAIESSTTRLTRMVADLLDMSRLQTGAVSPVLSAGPAAAVIDAALADLSPRDRVRVVPPLPDVTADIALLERALANLIGNALRHTDGPVEVTGGLHGQRASLVVVDHGPGVPAAARNQIFEPFQRLGDHHADDGVGLGLAVSRGLVEAQGGSLHAEETPGGGLSMVLELPAAR
jgi:two-component system sensor histidine kinase KdpD